MELLSRDRRNRYRSALFIERSGLTVRVIPVLMSLAILFAGFFLAVYFLLGKPPQWLVMLGAMGLTFLLFSIAYVFARGGYTDISVYIVVIALNLLGAGGALALEGWFAMSILLAYVGIACARLFTGRSQNWIVIIATTAGIIAQIMLTYYGPITKYTNPSLVQILLWIGYTISGLFVVAYILDIQDKRQEELLEQSGATADQLESQTTILEKQTVILQRRTDFLVKIMEVVQQLGSLQQFSHMVTLIVNSIQEVFGFYHVAYYEVTGPLSPAVLLDAAGGEAAEVKAVGFQVMLDAQDPIAEVARLGRSVLNGEDDRSESHIKQTKSRVTIPLRITQVGVAGVLDIQDRDEGMFQDDQLLLLQMLGEQLSLALEAAFRYEDINRRLEGALRVSREANLTSWREWIQTNPNPTYCYVRDGYTQAAAVDAAVNSGLVPDRTEYALPLKTVQGEILGKITAHQTHRWTTEEITLLESLIEQVEQTLENARLFQNTQRRAAREQMTRRISDSIRSATSVEDAIRRAVTELAEVVEASQVAVQFNVAQGVPPLPGEDDA